MKKAVILFNLGGPDKLETVEPFLFNLFKDPEIISIPAILRYPLAKFISKRRAPIAKNIYKEIGNKSPILELTQNQAKKLENNLCEIGNYKCFVVMRCWHPRAEHVISEIKLYNPDEVILMPLYPQFSASTSGSSINEWKDICNKNNYTKPTKTICCYPIDVEFLNAHISLIKEEISNLENFKLIFSAHGLPERNIKKGDPYQWQIESSVNEIVKNLNHPDLDWILSYQSRVGPLKWIGPSTDDEIINASKLNQTIVVVPIAFVSEHSETLVELDIEYKKLAMQNGCKNFKRIKALGEKKEFISSLANLVLKCNLLNDNQDFCYPKIKCPENFKKCPCSARL